MAAGWRQIYNQWEKAVAPTLEQLTASDAFRDVVAVGMQVSKAVMTETEKASRQWLHLWNLPAAGDVRNLRRQISQLDHEVQALRRALHQATEGVPAPGLSLVDPVDAGEPSAETDALLEEAN
jgi:hypothetical protein